MRILMVEPCPENFGGYYRSIALATALAKQKISVDLLFCTQKKLQLNIEHQKISNYLNIYKLPRFYLNFYINGRVIRGLIALVFGLINNYDVIQLSSPIQIESNLPAIFLKLFRKKVVIAWDDIWANGTIKSPILNAYISFWENFAPAHFGNIVCISQIIENRAKYLGAKNTIIIHNGTDSSQTVYTRQASRRRLKLEPDNYYLVTFGNSFDNDRNYLILKAFQKIHAKEPRTRLIINHNPFSLLEGHPNKSDINPKLKNYIINVGYIPEKLLNYYLSAADAILFLMGQSYNEKACFPVRLTRFLSSLRPIIINDNQSETTELLKKYKCAIIHPEISQLTDLTVKYLHNHHHQTIKHTNLKKIKLLESWDKIIKNLIEYYEKIK